MKLQTHLPPHSKKFYDQGYLPILTTLMLFNIFFTMSFKKSESPIPSTPTISISDFKNLAEPNTTGTIFLSLSEPATATTTINLSYIDITAKGGIDYLPSTLAQINTGQKNATITISLIDDNIVEDIETFTVRISSVNHGVNISSSSNSITLSIADDDKNLQLTQNHYLVDKWAPEVRLTSGESSYPASVDWFLRLVELRYFISDSSRIPILPVGSLTMNKLISQSYNGELSGNLSGITTNFFLNIPNNQIRRGQLPINNMIAVPCYAHLKRSAYSNSIDIQYWFFYPFNPFGGGPTGKIGRHDGDWEHITVRISADGNTLLGVYFARHSAEGQWEFKFETTSDGRPIVYSARDSHASYSTRGTHKRRHSWLIDLPDDRTDGAGPVWKCWQNNVIEIGEINNPLNGQVWLKFSGRWGGSFGTDMGEQPSPYVPSFKDSWNDEGIGLAWNLPAGNYYDNGNNPSVHITGNGTVVEAHNGGGNNNLYYNIGRLNSNHTISWIKLGMKYDTGDRPDLYVTNSGTVVEVHNGGGNNNLYYNIGRLNSNYTISWVKLGVRYDTGDNPSVYVTDNGTVVEVHNGGGNNNLYYNIGRLNSNYTISWVKLGARYDTGDSPSVYVTGNATVVEIHNGGGNNNLYYNIGRLNSNYTISWVTLGVQYDTGDNPTVHVTSDGTVVEIHNGGGNNNLYYNVGRLNSNYTIWWHTIGRLSDTGDSPAIAITNDAIVVDIHNGGGNNNLYYNVGKLIK